MKMIYCKRLHYRAINHDERNRGYFADAEIAIAGFRKQASEPYTV
jgi:hypothetical protein